MRAERLHEAVVPSVLGLGLLWISLASRPLVPLDETRYASVAWEMWTRGDWLVPHLNGVPYSHKPPLLFWLVCLGWRVAGVSEAWLRAVPALFALGSLFVTVRLARRLWPAERECAALAAWILFGTGLWALFGTVLSSFDPLLAFFTLVGSSGLLQAIGGRPRSGWLLFGLALGAGILTKGPVIFLHTLPVALLAPWWAGPRLRGRLGAWYGGTVLATLLAVAIALAWAVPAALAGGETYAGQIFWGQTANRVVESFTHRHAWWFYLAFLPVVLFPWSLWPSALRALGHLGGEPADPGVRFCIAWTFPGLILLSLSSAKQPQYLLPLLPGFALLLARALVVAPPRPGRPARVLPALALASTGVQLLLVSLWATGGRRVPDWSRQVPPWAPLALLLGAAVLVAVPRKDIAREVRALAAAIVFFLAVAQVGAMRPVLAALDVRGVAEVLRHAQEEGRAVAHAAPYYGQYHFLGRLLRPIEVIDRTRIEDWAREHPRGKLVLYLRQWNTAGPAEPDYVQPYRGVNVTVWSSEAVLAEVAGGRPRWK